MKEGFVRLTVGKVSSVKNRWAAQQESAKFCFKGRVGSCLTRKYETIGKTYIRMIGYIYFGKLDRFISS